jgi:AcrR family transcriptional regulator
MTTVSLAGADRRADSQRNRGALLEAAARAFAEGGIDVPADEIARRAGVAKGTLFRHFTTKRDLVSEVLVDRLATLKAAVAEIAAERPPGLAALAELMSRGAEVLAADRSFFDAATCEGFADERLERAKRELQAALDAFVSAAQSSGEVRADVTGVDIAMLMMAATNTCAPAHENQPQLWRRYLALMIDGLRPQPTTLPPGVGAPRRTGRRPAREGMRAGPTNP